MTGKQRVLITAGAGGIGECLAKTFGAEGSRVHICDTDEQALEQILAANRGTISGTVADVSDPEAVDRLFEDVRSELGGLDVLINNAGTEGPIGPVEDISPEAWRRTLAVNLDGQFLCARNAVPLLKSAGSGCIINMSSTAGLGGCPNRSPYVASKWAVIGLTKTLAMELGIFGIRVNAICPGSVEGERIRRELRFRKLHEDPDSTRRNCQPGALSLRRNQHPHHGAGVEHRRAHRDTSSLTARMITPYARERAVRAEPGC